MGGGGGGGKGGGGGIERGKRTSTRKNTISSRSRLYARGRCGGARSGARAGSRARSGGGEHRHIIAVIVED